MARPFNEQILIYPAPNPRVQWTLLRKRRGAKPLTRNVSLSTSCRALLAHMNNEVHEKDFSMPDNTDESERSGIQEYLATRQQRRRILPRAVLVGACAGITALLFRAALTGASVLRNEILSQAYSKPMWGWVFPVLFTLLGTIVAVAITRRYAPEASGSGIPHLEAVLRRFRQLEWKRVLPVKFFGGILAIGSGLALGREGSTVQMGGAVGDALSRLLKVSKRERLVLISAGAGAGLAAAFNRHYRK